MRYTSHAPSPVACAAPGKGDLSATKAIPVDNLLVRATPRCHAYFPIGASSRGTPPCSWQRLQGTNDSAR